MSKFPLYDSLLKDVTDVDLTVAQKKSFVKKINKIDKNGNDFLYSLIKIHQIEQKIENNGFSLPYNGIFEDNNIIFDLDNFPNTLKQILFKFIGVHLNTMKEESLLKNKY